MPKAVLAGGSGYLGGVLAKHLQETGWDVVVLTRRKKGGLPWRESVWDGEKPGPWSGELEGSQLLINLSGKSVNCRYNEANKEEILQSRVKPTRALGAALAQISEPPAVWMNCSTATIYRHETERPNDEETGITGSGFSVSVAKAWEAAVDEVDTPATRKVKLRTSFVLGYGSNSALGPLLSLVRKGMGGPQAWGQQYVSWIHEQDWLGAVDWLYEHRDLSGAFNVTAPNPLRNRDFMAALRAAAGVKLGLPTPGWLLPFGAWLIGTETELIVKSRWVVPKRLVDSGFTFHFPTIQEAAADLIGKKEAPRE